VFTEIKDQSILQDMVQHLKHPKAQQALKSYLVTISKP
jgi:hypothetical protein